MKRGGFLLLALALFFLYSDTAAKIPDLKIYCKGYPKAACTLEYQAHCASDGKTYGNQCKFCNAYVFSGRKLRLIKFVPCNEPGRAED